MTSFGCRRALLISVLLAAVPASPAIVPGSDGQTVTLPDTPLTFGAFDVTFRTDGTFSVDSAGRPSMRGTWRVDAGEVSLLTADGPEGCGGSGRYRFSVDGQRVRFAVVSDDCRPRRMILDRSDWMPRGTVRAVPERRLSRTTAPGRRALPEPAPAAGSWPSFRGPLASGVADGQRLPDRWNAPAGEGVLWRTPIPGLAHSSPVVWGNRVFVTTAVSSRGMATFKPGLYGDGDASEDRSVHKWMLMAIDKRTGTVEWERVAHEGPPAEKRHIKSTYASATPATDGRIVVAWFGSQGIHAYDVAGHPLWTVDIGPVDVGAYDIPSYEWGPASSPILWNGLVIVQCDTQTDSFVIALDAATGETVWKTAREELPSWGTPTVVSTSAGPELVTNASNFIRAYDPRNGKELWRLGGSSKITAPTPVAVEDLIVVASGRAPERPLFVVRAGARGDLSLPEGRTNSTGVAWSRSGRGPYMPTPLIYRGLLYVLANNGVLDAYDLKTGREIYRERLPLVGSGYSASPIAADGRIYLSTEDGDMLVIRAGEAFAHIGTNPIGELLMATPALSEGVMYVRSVSSLLAIGRKQR